MCLSHHSFWLSSFVASTRATRNLKVGTWLKQLFWKISQVAQVILETCTPNLKNKSSFYLIKLPPYNFVIIQTFIGNNKTNIYVPTTHLYHILTFYFVALFFFLNEVRSKFIYLFIYGCVGSSFLCQGFL